LKAVLQDIVQFFLAQFSPIVYDITKINPPDITITKLEFKKKDVRKAIDTVLEIANKDYRTTQYRYYIDKDKVFNFEAIANDPIKGYFEGFNYQDPDVKSSDTKIVNKINIYRAIENSQDIEFVSTLSDSKSIELYGNRDLNITISDFVDTTSAEDIAKAILDLKKLPVKNIKVEDLEVTDEPFPFGFYLINNKVSSYANLVSEFTNKLNWDSDLTGNVRFEEDSTHVFSGRTSFKVELENVVAGDYIERTLDEVIYFPKTLCLYVRQEDRGQFFTVTIFDEDGASITPSAFTYLTKEDTGFLLQENGSKLILEQIGYNTVVTGQFVKISIDISALKSVKTVRFNWQVTGISAVLYLDRLEVVTESYFQNNLALLSANYSLDSKSLLASCEYGEQLDTIFDSIKKLDEKQINLIDIFQKS
jgi:hypothetical protein